MPGWRRCWSAPDRSRAWLVVARALYQLAYTRAPATPWCTTPLRRRRRLATRSRQCGAAQLSARRAELEKNRRRTASARWSHPDWWIAKLQAEYPAHWQAILEASLQHPPFTLRVNCRHGDVASYLQRLTEAGLPAIKPGPMR